MREGGGEENKKSKAANNIFNNIQTHGFSTDPHQQTIEGIPTTLCPTRKNSKELALKGLRSSGKRPRRSRQQ